MGCSAAVSQSGSRRPKQRYRTRLLLELLEDRCVPTTVTPTTFADGGLGSGSLRDAVLQFNADIGTADDTIQLLPGTYTLSIRNVNGRHETAGLTGDLNLTQTSHRWIIQGAGPSTIIDASQLQDRVFQIVNPGMQVVFQNLVIQGGLAQNNGPDGAVAGTTDGLGGGILNNASNITLDDVVVQNNVARGGRGFAEIYGRIGDGGGIYSSGGALTIAGARIANNQATGGLGAGYPGTVRIGGGGTAAGGGLYASGASLDISDSTLVSNRATGGRGGDGYIFSTFAGTYTAPGGPGGGSKGGGLYVNGGFLTIATSTIASNQATAGNPGHYGYDPSGGGKGGGLYNSGTLMVNNCTLAGNSASDPNITDADITSGAGIFNDGRLTLSNSILSANSTIREGGAIANVGMLTVSNSTLSGNTASGAQGYGGGGIENFRDGTLTVSNSTLSGNSAPIGGGIDNLGTLTVSHSTLSGNTGVLGGGIGNRYGTLTISNSTLSGNTATENGAGIYNDSTSPATLTNVTLTANRANIGGGSFQGGGLWVRTGAPVLHNTLIAGNFNGTTGTIRDDVFGLLNSGGDFNLIGDGTGMTGLQSGVNGNLVGSAAAPIDPRLGPLQDNGGPTKTHALLAGSPALITGNLAQLGVADQRGVMRSGGVNIGAYQASASAFVVTMPGTVASGTPFDVTVQAVDVFGQVAFGYRGTVTFRVTDPDPAVVLPADYNFTADDQGTHAFTSGFILITPGPATLTVADLANELSIDVTLTVNP
jgi:hypothetical protein